jgi:GT2 family glycosyltransferase
MKLSVIIVSYNVRHFLEQCLHSVQRAMQGINGEVFVVDNDSVDTSCQMVEERFPWVRLIANKHNAGFSAANNQAIHLAQGSYILLLNPDTVIEDDTLTKVVSFMDDHPEAGGLGVKMVDGKGRFLPESKRSLPTPGVAFAKIFGCPDCFRNHGPSEGTTWDTSTMKRSMRLKYCLELLCCCAARYWTKSVFWMKAFLCMEKIST